MTQKNHWKEKYEKEGESLRNKNKEYEENNRRHKVEMKNFINEKEKLSEDFEIQRSSWLKQSKEHKTKVDQLYADIEHLKNENATLKEKYEDQKTTLEKEKVEEAALLSDMEKQMHFLLGGTMREGNQFNGKVAFVKALERKLEELTSDIHDLEDSIDEID